MTDTDQNVAIDLGKYKLGWSDEEDYVYKPQKGLNEDIIREMIQFMTGMEMESGYVDFLQSEL